MKNTHKHVDYAILGAGISGLSCAYFLKKRYPQKSFVLLEASAQCGGVIQSKAIDGFLFEQGPRTVRSSGKGEALLKLSEELGLKEQIIFSEKSAKVRYIYTEGRLHKVPPPLKELLRSPVSKAVFSALINDLKAKPNDNSGKSLAEFAQKQWGNKLLDTVLGPVVSGVWAGDPKQMEIDSVFPKLRTLQKNHGSLIKGLIKTSRKKNKTPKNAAKGLLSFPKGLSELITALEAEVCAELHKESPVMRIEPQGLAYNIQCPQGSWDAQRVISTIPAYTLGKLLTWTDQKLRDDLQSIPYAPLAVVSLGFKRNFNLPQGFGYLVPQKEQQNILGVLFNDQIFPKHAPQNTRSLTVMIGGACFENFAHYRQEDFMAIAYEHLQRHLKVQGKAELEQVTLYSKAIPQYNLGHAQKVLGFESLKAQNFWIWGNFLRGVSLPDLVIGSDHLIRSLN